MPSTNGINLLTRFSCHIMLNEQHEKTDRLHDYREVKQDDHNNYDNDHRDKY